jgi:hypothetical protein
VAQVVERVLSKCEALNQALAPPKTKTNETSLKIDFAMSFMEEFTKFELINLNT